MTSQSNEVVAVQDRKILHGRIALETTVLLVYINQLS
jgi:hypothetical protein